MCNRFIDWLTNKFLDIWWAVSAPKSPEPLVPWAPVEYRDYQWDAELDCPDCEGTTTHRFIEWLEPGPARVTTAQCRACDGEEFLFDVKGDR